MKAMITLLFLAALAVYARAEMLYHPQAILQYLEMEDREIARKVRNVMKLNDGDRPSGFPTGRPRPSGFPSGFPSGVPLDIKKCIVTAIVCHKRAGDNPCEHLKCIKKTSCCLKVSNFRLPPPMRKCLPIIPCCMLASESCAEKLCCFVRFGECLKRLGDLKDAE